MADDLSSVLQPLSNLDSNTLSIYGINISSFHDINNSIDVAIKKGNNFISDIISTTDNFISLAPNSNSAKPPSNVNKTIPEKGTPSTPTYSRSHVGPNTIIGEHNLDLVTNCDFVKDLKLSVCGMNLEILKINFKKRIEAELKWRLSKLIPFLDNIRLMVDYIEAKIKLIKTYINQIKAVIQCMKDVVGAIKDTVGYITSLPGEIVSAATGCLNKLKNLLVDGAKSLVNGIMEDLNGPQIQDLITTGTVAASYLSTKNKSDDFVNSTIYANTSIGNGNTFNDILSSNTSNNITTSIFIDDALSGNTSNTVVTSNT